MKRIICKVLGHKYVYNFGWMPNKAHCDRCGKKWKTDINPFYTGNPIEDDIHIWIEDKGINDWFENQEPLDPEFAKVMDEMLKSKIGNKPTKDRKFE